MKTLGAEVRKWQVDVWEAAESARKELAEAIPEEWEDAEAKRHVEEADKLELEAYKHKEQHYLDRAAVAELVDSLRAEIRSLEGIRRKTGPTPQPTAPTYVEEEPDVAAPLSSWGYHEIKRWLSTAGHLEYVYDLRNLTGADLVCLTRDDVALIVGGGEEEHTEVWDLLEDLRKTSP